MIMEQYVINYIANGYNIASRTPYQTTLIKRKQFSIPILAYGLAVFVLPLLIYIIIYYFIQDKMVIISIVPIGAYYLPPPAVNLAPQLQTAMLPLSAPRSPDGNYWWDGQHWQPVVPLSQPHPIRTYSSQPYPPQY